MSPRGKLVFVCLLLAAACFQAGRPPASSAAGACAVVTAGALPAGMTLTPAGVLSGTATQPGTYSFTVRATDARGCVGTRNYTLTIGGTAALACVSAASYLGGALASESIVAAFGGGLAAAIVAAETTPLPTTLGGVRVSVRDSQGVERLAPLFFVSPTQINFQVPPGTARGQALTTVLRGNDAVAAGASQIERVAPGLFAANASGQGVANGVALRVKSDGTQSFEALARFDAATNRFVAVPINLGPAGDRVFLVLFGTGWRQRTALGAVTASIGGVTAEVSFAGPQGGFVGLDQLNLAVPRALAGRGEIEVRLTVDGVAANPLKVAIQ